MPIAIRPGDVLADRYLLVDLLSESGGGRFWRAHDRILDRHVAVHVIPARRQARRGPDGGRPALGHRRRPARAARARRRRARRRLLRRQRVGRGHLARRAASATRGRWAPAGPPGSPRRWPTRSPRPTTPGVAHGRLVPENVLIDDSGLGAGDRAVGRRRAARPARRAAHHRRHRPRRAPLLPAHRHLARRLALGGAAPPRTRAAGCCGRGRSRPASRARSTCCATR